MCSSTISGWSRTPRRLATATSRGSRSRLPRTAPSLSEPRDRGCHGPSANHRSVVVVMVIVVIVVAITDLTPNFTSGKSSRVDVRVGVAGLDGAHEFRELSRCQALTARPDNVGRIDGSHHFAGRCRTWRLVAASAQERSHPAVGVQRAEVNVREQHRPSCRAFEGRVAQVVIDGVVVLDFQRQPAASGGGYRWVLLKAVQAQLDTIAVAIASANYGRDTADDTHAEYDCRNDELPGHAFLRPWCGYLNATLWPRLSGLM